MDAYTEFSKRYGIRNISTEEVMDKLDMFQARFEKVYEFFWWDIGRIKTDAVT